MENKELELELETGQDNFLRIGIYHQYTGRPRGSIHQRTPYHHTIFLC